MAKLSKQQFNCKESQVTDEKIYQQRRQLLKKLGYVGAAGLLAPYAGLSMANGKESNEFSLRELAFSKTNKASISEKLTPESKVTTHNNFYEFGAQKHQPAELAQKFKVNPWQLKISGEVEKQLTLDYDDLFSRFDIEERIYRLRCVEAWSMVVPWLGFQLSDLIKLAQPTSKAKYVKFKTLYDPKQMPGQANRYLGGGIKYPYQEGLRMDEAMNPLTIMAVGLYGKTLPRQNGAPIRLVLPWKYGFKSIKSIVEIEFTEQQPATTWSKLAPKEYGFYANVNPNVDHPRWSQKSERRITSGGLFSRNRIDTQMFNGYGEQVAQMYQNMDLAKYY
ncbi:protein-methionine-sulfoxide reductase catalytic subunit MsrP [Thalassotalea sp. HSM 43]|uniref:protein-methionine-sulfoxide reductase catalytic subunit MsrP n=1 Tax=Thalassotalea sp. HSM 43 TaxID=2552945 RepID=UPI00108019E8|nr:protein-methionine-sulfoxide reductase catalytic subunit MsrP [Thalassotalea sp. HSM 43]QBY05249.1 protein-methionine-sulfoxide reductase catalytic subunit MsrP [Thalassotalea sp. HSM 43]